MLSYSENSRKQEIHHHPPNPFPPPKRDSCDSCDSFEKLKYRHDGMVIKS